MEKTSKILLYAQLGAAVLTFMAMAFGAVPTLAGVIFIFGIIGPVGAISKPRFMGVARYYLYLAVLSVVVVMTSTFFPFIGGKDYFFRFSVELALIFFILWWAFEARDGEVGSLMSEVYKKPVFIAVTLFVLVFLLASIFAHDPHAAFWANYERGEGGFEMLHYYAFFVLLILFFKKEDNWQIIFKVSLVAAALMILYGVFAQLGWATNFISPYQGGAPPNGLWDRLVGTRFQGSLGNPAYVAPYLLFAVFYALYLWISGKAGGKKWRDLGYGAIVFVFLFFFMISQTRGAFLGLGASVYAFLVLLGFLQPKRRRLSLGLIAAFIVGGGILVHFRNSGFVRALPGGRMFDMPASDHLLIVLGLAAFVVAAIIELARERKFLWKVLAALALVAAVFSVYAKSVGMLPNLSDQTTSTRFWTWGSAWQGFLERPVLGWGPENFSAVFDKYFDPRHYNPGVGGETWFDRAHSIYFDYLSETGILGLLSYLGIFAVVFWSMFKKIRGPEFGQPAKAVSINPPATRADRAIGPSGHSPLIDALVVALPIGYLVQGVAIFDVLPMYMNLFLFFAFGYYYLYDRKSSV